jgi:type I restriction enzyme S subunit
MRENAREWVTVPISECYEGLYDGPHATPKPADSGPVFLGIKNVTEDGRLDLSDVRHIAEEDFDRWTGRVTPRPGDIVFTYEATLNRYAIIPTGFRGCLGRRMALIRPNPARVNTRFLHYYFFADSWRQVISNNLLSGSTVDRIPITRFPQFPVCIPSLPTQDRIACILSAYDDLIENNLRRIRVLEQMARAAYREWFVNFRFPGHEKVPQVASPLGNIPQGWAVTTLRAITTKIGSGATPRGGKDAYKSEGVHLIRSLNIYDYNFEFADLAFIDEQQAAELDNVVVEENDVLLNITGASVARCAMVPSYLLPARVNQHVAIVRTDPAKASPFYVLDAINSEQRKQQLLALAQGGATREALTKDTVSNFEIVLPPRPLMERYGDIARGIHKQREVLRRQIQNLRDTRDLVLPRLMSGQIDISRFGDETVDETAYATADAAS